MSVLEQSLQTGLITYCFLVWVEKERRSEKKEEQRRKKNKEVIEELCVYSADLNLAYFSILGDTEGLYRMKYRGCSQRPYARESLQ